MTCGFADSDGAYVLGALSPAQRLAFEQHLAGCPDCARAVRELAGLPGLLSRVEPAVLEHPPAEDPVPATLLAALTLEVRRTRQRRLLVTAVAVAAAFVAFASLAISGLGGHESAPTPRAVPGRSASVPTASEIMLPVGRAPVSASLGFEPVAWGTRLSLVCTYAPGPEQYGLPRSVTYGLFVRTRDGHTEQVGTWRSLKGRTLRLTAATAASREEISSVEVRTTDGRAMLKLIG